MSDQRATTRLSDVAMRLRVPYQTAHRLLLLGEIEGERPPSGRGWAVFSDSVDAYELRRPKGEAPS